MSKSLNEKRDELAKDYSQKTLRSKLPDYPQTFRKDELEKFSIKDFKSGWDQAIQALSESAQEFDSASASEASDAYWEGSEESVLMLEKSFEEGARWQFEQMKAQVGYANARRFEVRDSANNWAARAAEAEDKIQQLERELGEWKVKYIEARQSGFTEGKEEAREDLERLKALPEYHTYMKCEQDLDAKDARIAKLEKFITKWLAFEQNCIDKDGPYVSPDIPALMKEARRALSGPPMPGYTADDHYKECYGEAYEAE